MIPNLDTQLLPYSRNRAVHSSANRSNAPHLEYTLPSSASDNALEQHLPEDSQTASPSMSTDRCQVSDPAGMRLPLDGGMLGDVTNTAHVQSEASPRTQSAALMHDAGFSSVTSSPRGKDDVSNQLCKGVTVLQQQHHGSDGSKANSADFTRQKRISVDTRGTLKQSVFRVADVPLTQTSSWANQQDVPAESALHQPSQAIGSAADSHSHIQQQRMPFAEHPDPQGNRISPPPSTQLPPVELPSGLVQHSHAPESHLQPQSMYSLEDRAGRQSPRQLPHNSAQADSTVVGTANPEALQAVTRAALVQTCLQAQHAEGNDLARAVSALQPLVSTADPLQVQQCLPQVCYKHKMDCRLTAASGAPKQLQLTKDAVFSESKAFSCCMSIPDVPCTDG